MDERQATARRRVPEEVTIRRWRNAQFLMLGYDVRSARELARSDADLALARRLLQSGCCLDTARRIVL